MHVLCVWARVLAVVHRIFYSCTKLEQLAPIRLKQIVFVSFVLCFCDTVSLNQAVIMVLSVNVIITQATDSPVV